MGGVRFRPRRGLRPRASRDRSPARTRESAPTWAGRTRCQDLRVDPLRGRRLFGLSVMPLRGSSLLAEQRPVSIRRLFEEDGHVRGESASTRRSCAAVLLSNARRSTGGRGFEAGSRRSRLADHPRLEWAVDRIETVEELVETVSRCDYVVAARFHSVLLPLSLGIPTIGLAYQPKTCELLAQVGRPARCFDIDSFEVGELEAALEKLRAEDRTHERAELLGIVGRFRDAVEEQFDLLFPARA